MSDGGSTSMDETSKRPREEEEDAFFSKSKKTGRSPPTKYKKSDEKLDKIMYIIQEMKEELTEMRKDHKEYREDIKMLRLENEKLRSEQEKVKKENEEIKKEILRLRNSMDHLERDKRERNIVLTGLQIDTQIPKDIASEVSDFIKTNLSVDIKINSARKIGQKIIWAELENLEDKARVMTNKSKLKGRKDLPVYINNDLTANERNIQREIRIKAQELKKDGKSVKIGFHKITSDDGEAQVREVKPNEEERHR
ncbi:hypothetical protein MML48_4g00012895 [Holotrichia oblita]|uniref:Uncharacterized protein n=1 Tax=Holotrichia oblita TaxID=644536 RepID=A0ACB9T9D8_HOLOL|nr:hypothetical protein MML48_4g00012895 [Holotrichia oblita]